VDQHPLLLPLLDKALERRKHLEPADIEDAARSAGLPAALAWETANFYPRYQARGVRWLLVDEPVLRSRNFDELLSALKEAAVAAGVAAGTVYSYGLEAVGPALVVEDGPERRVYAPVDLEGIRKLADGSEPGTLAELMPRGLARTGGWLLDSPGKLPDLSGAGGLIADVDSAGLRGLGGALFPSGRKLAAVQAQESDVKYVVVNGDESEPGNFKDRWLMEHNPRLVWAGAALAARAVGAKEIIFYVRGEYTAALARVEAARAELEASGYFEDLHTRTFRGGGLYICGEESALLESIEGRRAEPRLKPPYPAEAGLFGRPTLVSNVETLAHMALISLRGADSYREYSPKLFSISGDVRRPGVYELPLGTPLQEALETAGASDTRAVLMGGAAGTFLRFPENASLPLDYDAPRALGDSIGPGALMVFDSSRDLWAAAESVTAFFAHESCGRCFPCSLGTPHLHQLVLRWRQGEAQPELMRQLGETLEKGSLCGLGQAAPWAVRSLIDRFEEVAR